MERDFKKEFKELKQSEVPDLWNRIEAGITPKPTVAYAQEKKKPRQTASVYRWALFAAACLCVLIMVPALSLTRSNSSSSGMTADMSGGAEEPAEDSGWSVVDETVASEPTENAESNMDEYVGEAANGAADIYAEADEIIEENVMEDRSTNKVESAMSRGSKKEMDRADDSADWNSILQEGQLLNEAIIEVLKIEQLDNADAEYTVQAVIVSSDEEGFLPEDIKLILICNAETLYDIVGGSQKKTPLQMGETYTVDLRYEGNGDFVVMKIIL